MEYTIAFIRIASKTPLEEAGRAAGNQLETAGVRDRAGETAAACSGVSAKGIADHFPHLPDPDRFDQYLVDTEIRRRLGRDQLAVPRAENDGDVRPDFFHAIGQVEPAQMRHRLVRNDKIEFVGAGFECFQGFDTADPLAHFVAELKQHVAVGFTDDFFVIHKEDPPSSAGMNGCRIPLCHGQLSRETIIERGYQELRKGTLTSVLSVDGSGYEYDESMISPWRHIQIGLCRLGAHTYPHEI